MRRAWRHLPQPGDQLWWHVPWSYLQEVALGIWSWSCNGLLLWILALFKVWLNNDWFFDWSRVQPTKKKANCLYTNSSTCTWIRYCISVEFNGERNNRYTRNQNMDSFKCKIHWSEQSTDFLCNLENLSIQWIHCTRKRMNNGSYDVRTVTLCVRETTWFPGLDHGPTS